MPIRWFSEKPISDALAISAQSALQRMNEFTLTDENFRLFTDVVRGQRILLVALGDDDTMTNVGDMSNLDYNRVIDRLLRPLIGFHWHRGYR